MRPSGHIEPLSGVLRIGGAYGDPYRYAVTLRYLSPREVEILSVLRAPTPSEWRAMAKVLRAAGIERARFSRCRAGILRPRIIHLRPQGA